MVVHKIDVRCVVAIELEHQPPISGHGNRPLSGAGFERELISARTGEGRARTKGRGVKLGRKPKLTLHQKRGGAGEGDHYG